MNFSINILLRRIPKFAYALFAFSKLYAADAPPELLGKRFIELFTSEHVGWTARIIDFGPFFGSNIPLAIQYANIEGNPVIYLPDAFAMSEFESFENVLRIPIKIHDRPLNVGDPILVREDVFELHFESPYAGELRVSAYVFGDHRFRLVDYEYGKYLAFVSSVRAELNPNKVAILGFNVPNDGIEFREVLIRASGPSLRKFGVSDCASGTRLAVYRSDGKIIAVARDESWDASKSSHRQIYGASVEFGAFLLDEASNEQALVLVLPPGIYTAVVTLPKDGAGGTVLCEAYISR